VLLAAAIALVAMLGFVASSSSSTAPLGLVITLPAIWIGLVVLGLVATVVLAVVPARHEPLALSLTVVPLLAGVLSLTIPEALKHNLRSLDGGVLFASSFLSIPVGALLGLGLAAAWSTSMRRTALAATVGAIAAWLLFVSGCGGGWSR
jgi:hypothetical protein